MSAGVACRSRAVYLGPVILVRILSLLVALALFGAPMGMIGAAPAKASATTEQMDHCAGKHQSSEKRSPDKKSDPNCCIVGCTGIPSNPVGISGLAALQVAPVTMLPSAVRGLEPEATDPPPRRA